MTFGLLSFGHRRYAQISDFGGEIIGWWDATYPSSLTQSGGVASAWNDRGQRQRTVTQGTGANQPAVTSTYIQFDGVNDTLNETGSVTAVNTASQTVPDGQGNAGVGTAFSLTHLFLDPVTGGWIFGNDGRATEASPGTQRPSIVFTDITGATKTAELDLTPAIGNVTVQGVCVDPADGHIWICSGQNAVKKINRNTGAQISSFSYSGANGLAIQPDGTLWVGEVNTNTARHLDQSGNPLAAAFSVNADGMFYHQEFDQLWCHADPSDIRAYECSTGKAMFLFSPSEYNEAEGIYLVGDTMYVTHNGSFHAAGSPAISKMFTYTLSGHRSFALRAAVDLFFVGNLSSYGGTTLCMISNGDPLTARGYGIYIPNSTTMRATVFSAASASVDFTTTPLTRGLWHLEINGSAQTVTLRLNGAVVGAANQSIAGISGNEIPCRPINMGASYEGAAARWSAARLSAIVQRSGDAPLSTANRQIIEGILAWDHGLTALLDPAHPYASQRP